MECKHRDKSEGLAGTFFTTCDPECHFNIGIRANVGGRGRTVSPLSEDAIAFGPVEVIEAELEHPTISGCENTVLKRCVIGKELNEG
ncbi:MAG TPA: hypothetical protein VJ733_13120 [Candidatus Binatia bacterium]|nr:hypothetical protein [Candidatus Binatia bacterium]